MISRRRLLIATWLVFGGNLSVVFFCSPDIGILDCPFTLESIDGGGYCASAVWSLHWLLASPCRLMSSTP
jgi:hypothetical protein